MPSSWFSAHTHSRYSQLDGMSNVADLVYKAAVMGQPAIGLTDHGNMAGTVQLYKSAKKEGILPFPGVEIYIADPRAEDPLDAKAKRYHACVLATDLKGYKALVKTVSLSHTRPRFSRFPRLLISDLIELGKEAGEHVIFTTGCFFGLIQQTMASDGFVEARRLVKQYQQWFPNLVVELQNHNIDHEGSNLDDASMVKSLWHIAKQLGLPVIATQDTHYTNQRQKKAHALMKRMVYAGEDDAFPGDHFHMASAEWVQSHYDRQVWHDALQGAQWILDKHALTIPPLDKFKAYVPEISKTPMDRLRKLCTNAFEIMAKLFSTKKRKQYLQRLEEELDVISFTGTGNYFLLVRKYIRWCNDQKITVEARGSANASLVCYLLRITQIDPIQWGNLFERFMSKDRIKPPDIDMDVEDLGHPLLIAELKRMFTLVRIGTWAKLGASAQDPTRGSVLVTYQGYLRRLAERKATEEIEAEGGLKGDIPKRAREFYAKRYGWVQSIDDVAKLNTKDHRALAELASMGSIYKSAGTHAGGLLLGTGEIPIDQYVPTMLIASKETTVSQFDMDDVEEFGLLKLDVLGQVTLTVMKLCQTWIGRDNPSDFSWIPLDDKKACRLLREGRPDNGIFHFEGYTKARGGKELGVMNTKDSVLVQALYMPGAMETGQKDLYIRGRRDKAYARKVIQKLNDEIHPIYADVLRETNGAVIFQEQPMRILRELGMSIGNINVLFKVVKDSGSGAIERNAARMASLRGEFDKLCADNGVGDVEQAWHLVTGFISYGFNRAHATGYGLRSYRCAYLKAHYPLEFMTALLHAHAGDKKEAQYVREARRMKLRLLPPDVNKSDWNYAIEGPHIRKGLLSIHGIGAAAAIEIASHRPYNNMIELIDACTRRAVSGGEDWRNFGTFSGNLQKLNAVGALDCIL